MAKVNQPPTQAPAWPWGGPRSVREKLVDPIQLERKKKKKLGNPKNPALASVALLDFIGPGHTSEELRLPLPPSPLGHQADVETFLDRPHLLSVASRADEEHQQALEDGLVAVNASPERLERMKALLGREGQMLSLVGHIGSEMREILRLMWDAQKDEDY